MKNNVHRSIQIRQLDNPSDFQELVAVICGRQGEVQSVRAIGRTLGRITREIQLMCADDWHAEWIMQGVAGLRGVEILHHSDDPFPLHLHGKIEVTCKLPVDSPETLALVYTPGVAKVCEAIHHEPQMARDLTIKGNSVAVVTDGSAVLGLGNLGPQAALPVMEGKAMLFKQFGGIDAFPICLASQDVERIVQTVVEIAPGFGGINLEDISAPRCFEIEERLQSLLEIPVFHDDQHGTAVVVLAGLWNAAKVTRRKFENLHVVIAGAGAAGVAIAKILHSAGVTRLVVCDRLGVISNHRQKPLTRGKDWIAQHTNQHGFEGSLAQALVGADVFIGVSGPNLIGESELRSMAQKPIVFALANPQPEVDPKLASSIAGVLATGRSDMPNQINNVLAFPGIFRGTLEAGASRITEAMKLAAARAISDCVPRSRRRRDYIIPSVFDERVSRSVARAVMLAVGKS